MTKEELFRLIRAEARHLDRKAKKTCCSESNGYYALFNYFSGPVSEEIEARNLISEDGEVDDELDCLIYELGEEIDKEVLGSENL